MSDISVLKAPDYSTLNATPKDVLSPYTFIGKAGVKESGEIENRKTVIMKIRCGESYNIEEGWHSGSGYVIAEELSEQTKGSITANVMAEGKTAWVNGVLVTGNIPIGVEHYTPIVTYANPLVNIAIEKGIYYGYSNAVKTSLTSIGSAINISPNDIAAGKSIFGVSGTFTNGATITAEMLREGKTIYANGTKIVGTMKVPSLY